MRLLIAGFLLACTVNPGMAQTSDGFYYDAFSPSMASVVKSMHATIQRDLADAVESMPADEYSFRPTPQVRSFAELVAHLASANFFFCAPVKGERPPQLNSDKLTDKVALVKALKASFAYCDDAYAATTDENVGQLISMPGAKPSQAGRGAVLFFNTTHNNEHYGNIVVYLRLKGHVPPSTARIQAPK